MSAPATAEQTQASGSSFYAGMRVLPKAEREAMFAVYGFCRQVDDIADDLQGERAERRAQLDAWRADIEVLYAGGDPGRAALVAEPVRRFGLRKADFLAVIDGMQMDADEDIRAPDMAKLDLYCDRVASAVGRLSVRIFGMDDEPGEALAAHLGRALQLTNILRDLDEDAGMGRLYLPRELLDQAGITGSDPEAVVADPRVDVSARALAAEARRHYIAAEAVMAARPKGRLAAPRLMGKVYGRILDGTEALGWAPPRRRVKLSKAELVWILVRYGILGSSRTIHVIGAGLSGLSAAVTLAGRGERVVVHEGAGQAGGRCRSYLDPQLGAVIDNGNHLVLSGNRAVHAYLEQIGSADRLTGPATAAIAFADLTSGERWTIRPNEGRLPWWIFARDRRVPGATPGDYLSLAALLRPPPGRRMDQVIRCEGRLWEALLQPFLLAVLNTEPEAGAADLASAVVRETLGLGGAACRPRIAHPTLASAFVDPALAYLESHGAEVHLGKRVRSLELTGGRAACFALPDREVALEPDDLLILAVPPWAAQDLIPGLSAPDEFRAIVNGHFLTPAPAGAEPMTGVIGATAEWVFAFPDRISVTVSGADRLLDDDREDLARRLWADVAALHHLPSELPPWQIVKERRATFAATPAQNARRPGARTQWDNLLLAGDWTATGLPATIEGALRSGRTAADLAKSG